jgi:hypothetical protein
LAAIVPCEQQFLFELAINSGDFYVMFQRENHFINKSLQKPRRLNVKCMPAVNKTNNNQKTIVVQITHIFQDIFTVTELTDKSFAPQCFFDFGTAYRILATTDI